jgi:hypothetical protein
MMHQGQFNAGHYWCYINPSPQHNKWFMFNDNHVTPISEKAALQTAFGSPNLGFTLDGGRIKTRNITSNTNAYKLVYVKESELGWFLKDTPTSIIPKGLQRKFDQEQESLNHIDQLVHQETRMTSVYIFTKENCRRWPEHGINMFNYEIYDDDYFILNPKMRIKI